MKTIVQILLVAAIGILAYFCVMSILTPIRFTQEKGNREKQVVQRLIDIRTAEVEFRDQHNGYCTGFPELINFLKTGKKKTLVKEGALTDAQLEAGLTEEQAVKIVNSGIEKDIIANNLQHFRRDTVYLDLIPTLYGDRYTAETIDEIRYVPYSENKDTFLLEVDNGYINVTGLLIPLFQASCKYETYLSGLNRQEMLNAIDLQRKLEKFPGLMVGSIQEPNNNAGNWE